MARVTRVAAEIIYICKDNNIDINYYKVQKLAYLCQCVNYGKYNVPLCPESIWNWNYGGGFKEIYAFPILLRSIAGTVMTGSIRNTSPVIAMFSWLSKYSNT